MLTAILNFSILALALPLSAFAANHGAFLNRRHADLAKRSDVNVTIQERADGARMTYYDVETGNAGSCGKFHTNADFTVALSATQMNPSLCYKQIRITYNGKTAYADISDTCPVCPPNGLDLTIGLFGYLTSLGDGVIYGTWEYADAAPAPPAPVYTPPPAPVYTPPPPPPTTTSTWVAPKPSTTSTTSSSSIPSSVSSVTSSSAGQPSSSPGSAPSPASTNNLGRLNQAFIQLGALFLSGNELSS